jgi:hypothetical protein
MHGRSFKGFLPLVLAAILCREGPLIVRYLIHANNLALPIAGQTEINVQEHAYSEEAFDEHTKYLACS